MKNFSITCGQPLVLVEGLVYLSPGLADFSLEALAQLHLKIGATDWIFGCASDGESLEIGQGDLEEANLGEYGVLKKHDLSSIGPFQGLISRTLISRYDVVQKDSGKRVGVVFRFNQGELTICNWGDTLRSWNNVPSQLFESEGLDLSPSI